MSDKLDQEILLKANEQLKIKQQAAKQRRENTLDSVKKLLSSDLSKAISTARELEGLPEFMQAIEIIKTQPKPDSICPECHGQLTVFFSTSQLRYVVGRCESCENIQREQKILAEKKRVKQKFIDELPKHLQSHGIPKRYWNAKLETAPAPFCNLKLSDIKSLYLSGPRGVGKTHLACSIANYLIENTEPVLVRGVFDYFQMPIESMPLFVNVPELLMEIRDTQKKESETSEKKIIDRYSNVPVLIFDDIGVEKNSEWVFQTFYTLINKRYNEELITIITSNLTLEELAAKISDRIASRIAEMCKIISLKGEDRRLKK